MDKHTFKITSTGLSGEVILSDLGLDNLSHPVIQFDLIDIGILLEEIESSDDLYQALKHGNISAVFDDFDNGGIKITSGNVDKSSIFDDPDISNAEDEWNEVASIVQSNSADWALSGTVSGNLFTKNGIDSSEKWKIPDNYHKIVQDYFYVDGELIIDGDFLLV